MIPSQPCQQWQPDGPDLLESLKANRQLHHALGHDLIPTAISYDTFAQVLAAMDAMRSGIAMRVFQASQQASTISS